MTHRSFGMALAAALLASAAAAQESDDPTRPDRAGPLLEWEIRADGTYIDNFFQAPDGGENVFAAGGRGQVALPFADGRGRAFLRLGGTAYDRFAPSVSLTGGGRWNRGIHYFQASGAARLRNPRVELGGRVGSADVFLASGSYSIRPVREIEASALVDYYRGVYSEASDRNHDFLGGGGSLRYRGFGYDFMPEIGAATGRLDVRTDTEDYRQNALWVSASSIPVEALYLSTRYRYRARDYSTDDPTSSSFGREDARHQITVVGDAALGGPWSLLLYYSFQNAHSTLPSRVFSTHLLVTGLAYRFGGR